jgi:hypothetical protein
VPRPPSRPPPGNSLQHHATLIERIARHPIALLLGLIATILVVAGAIYDALRHPDISAAAAADVSQPFAFPFVVKNSSSLFLMSDTQMFCGIGKVVLTGNRTLTGFVVTDGSHRATIAPGNEPANFRCVALGSGPGNVFLVEPNVLVSAHIDLWVKYKTLGFSRTSPATSFTWYTGGTPPQWVRGTVVD